MRSSGFDLVLEVVGVGSKRPQVAADTPATRAKEDGHGSTAQFRVKFGSLFTGPQVAADTPATRAKEDGHGLASGLGNYVDALVRRHGISLNSSLFEFDRGLFSPQALSPVGTSLGSSRKVVLH
ncbi:hypothetical protein CASFOL_001575 [Castilleja foliolosa]|uniref:Uncharacterized protein n=1 Tax=Castilleja foliolosa TaxID=1961234 RepID=A0ABD3EJZ1_9LAMI